MKGGLRKAVEVMLPCTLFLVHVGENKLQSFAVGAAKTVGEESPPLFQPAHRESNEKRIIFVRIEAVASAKRMRTACATTLICPARE